MNGDVPGKSILGGMEVLSTVTHTLGRIEQPRGAGWVPVGGWADAMQIGLMKVPIHVGVTLA